MALHPMPATREEWLALRGKRIGASEVAALWDVQADFALSRYALWHVKAGNAPAPPVDNPRVTWGLKLEEVIATAAAEEQGWTVRRGRYAICDDEPGLAASLDFEIDSDPTGRFEGPGVLETKNVDFIVHKRAWTDEEPPVHILLQLQAQLAASGFAWGAVASLVGGNDLRIYPYAAKPALIAEIKRRAGLFWASIANNEPPPVDGSDSATSVLRSLYPDPVDDVVDMTSNNEWSEAVERFIASGENRKQANKDYDAAKNRVVALLGGHKRGWGGGYTVNTSIVPEKEPRSPEPGEMIPGRAETRRYVANEYAA